jgi:hypothetical protein
MSRNKSVLALAAGLLLPIAACAAPGVNNGNGGYFPTAGAPLVAPSTDDGATSGSTVARQQESGYFPSADAPLVAPDNAPGDASQTLPRQRASGYYPEPDAPMVAPSPSYR